ncbi:MAG: DNA-directed RNA polymerase subunit delta [Erysipelotrichaceae bacterium]|nr:DNA-directed RNA polymerase subunit delta [Erysipelotrichaceae bacterium]
MANQTMTDVAYNCLSKRKKGMEFIKLYDEVIKTLAIPENLQKKKRAQFYSELMLDNRFANLDNKWDLRARHTFDETHFDTSEIEIDDDVIFEDEIIDDNEEHEDHEENTKAKDDEEY